MSKSKNIINKKKMMEEINVCTECEACIDVCCTYYSTGNPLYSPLSRIKIIEKLLNDKNITQEEIRSIYYCTECGRCEEICPEDIKISSIIADSKIELVNKGLGPLTKHNVIINGIFEKRNAVNGDPEKRLDWIPEEYRSTEKFEEEPSETLLYVGCLPSFLVKECASASYKLLKKVGIDFMVLKDEYCCGIYPYNAGKIEVAKKIFEENIIKFKKLGIKRIIVPCAGCYRCFSTYYPRLFGKTDFKVFHIVQIIYDLIKNTKISLKNIGENYTFHDSCRLGRKAGLYDEPRYILRECGVNIEELPQNRENAFCCGAGSGVRSIDKELSKNIGAEIIKDSKNETIISSCPFCIFNLSYIAYKMNLNKKIKHISNLILENIEE
jgi:heterodisulfide reductase subunit D